MRILLTRPEADAARTAATLRARGHQVILAPLLAIEILPDAEFGAGPWSALLITSANAVRAIAAHRRRDELRGLPAFAVGRQSAQGLRGAGFAEVISADGDVGDLAGLVAARAKPASSLLYLAGAERSGDLAGVLRRQNFAVETAVVYRAIAADKFTGEVAVELASGVDAVLHFSTRSAETYITAARAADLTEAALATPAHFCLSARIAAPLLAAGATTIRIAAQPEEAALLALCG